MKVKKQNNEMHRPRRLLVVLARCKGLSLVEFLIASALGFLVIGAVLQTFDASRDTTRMVRSVSDLQESGWAALRLLERDIQMAAFGGCANGPTMAFSMVADNGPINNLYEQAVQGFTVNDTGQWVSGPSSVVSPDSAATDPVANSDIVSVFRGANASARVVENDDLVFGDPLVVTADDGVNFNKDDLVIVSNCSSADVFRVTNDPTITDDPNGGPSTITLAHDASGNRSENLEGLYQRNAQLRQFLAHTYYVGLTGRSDPSGNEISALYRVTGSGVRQELVQGVETLQILYGERLSNSRIRYSDVTEHDIDWADVISVRIALLVSGVDRTLPSDDANTYNLGGIVTAGPEGSDADIEHASDRRLRRVFSTTIFIQNKAAALDV